MDRNLGLCGLKQSFMSIVDRMPLVWSFSFYKALTIVLLTDTFIFPEGASFDVYGLRPQAMFFAFCALTCLMVAIFLRRNNHLFSRDWYPGVLMMLMLVGVFLLFLRSEANVQDPFSRDLCFVLGMGALALGFMGLHIEFGRLLGFLGTTQTLAYGITSSCIGGLLYLAVYFSNGTLRWIIIVSFFVISVLLFYRGRRSLDQKALFGSIYEEKLQIPYKFMTTSFIQGVSLGFLFGISSIPTYSLPLPTEVTAMIGSAVLTCIALLVLQIDFNRAIYQIGFPIVAIGMFLCGLSFDEVYWPIMMQVVGFLFLDLVLWALGSYLIKGCNQPATWVAACPSALLMTGRTFGLSAGGLIPPDAAPTFLLVGAFVIVLSALLLSSGKNIKTGWGFIRPGKPEQDTDLLQACAELASDFKLTPRESDVLRELATDKDFEEIAQVLFISQNTTKSHTQNIYSKLGIHSRKDLQRMISNKQKMFGSSVE